MPADEERIALFLDYENLAIGAREDLGGMAFDLKPLSDALAERGRVIVRRAYADWSSFDKDRRMLAMQHVELIEIPQRLGAVRKNAADIKMAVDAVELSFERDYITTFVICTGDSDFTPLVDKLRELDKRVIGVGLQASTSQLLPPACDEFLFYERLEGVNVPARRSRGSRRGGRRGGRGRGPAAAPQEAATKPAEIPAASSGDAEEPVGPAPSPEAVLEEPDVEGSAVEESALDEPDLDEPDLDEPDLDKPDGEEEPADLAKLVTQTLSGLLRSSGGAVLASNLKRAILRKDPTFNEADHGFRAFGELLRHLADRKVIEISEGPARGDPEVSFPEDSTDEAGAFRLLRDVVAELEEADGPPPLSGLKDQVRKQSPGFSEKEFGFGGFLQFCKAARTRGIVTMDWDEEADDYVLSVRAAEGDSEGEL
ncbi:NYN domain-containing protein [Egibacter rhizosphaerae]|uniref:NYN domain-containing protein n=1 Tax=Egibacter rhizosphaerae TaxID=1670831 RepID=A0A411YJ77_9ACTN|nr:PIN domain-containing protein [Egibacter rhizosphaerae]QBI21126.1 NYN domain-containing protein [Egibacter rhizosphaerae]